MSLYEIFLRHLRLRIAIKIYLAPMTLNSHKIVIPVIEIKNNEITNNQKEYASALGFLGRNN